MSVFPDGFLLGVTTSAFQTEGAHDEDGKGQSIWDRLLSERAQLVRDGSEIGIAADSYHLFKEDVRLIKELKFDAYKFSISWSRILPDGTIGNINQKGIQHYASLIDELVRNGITPMVTLYHFDLPAKLQEIGGWCNPLLIDYFVDYAKLMFQSYGNQVKWWTTFNEPLEIVHGYADCRYAPYLSLDCFDADYIVGHNLLKAHAAVYRMYRECFYARQQGKLSIILSGMNFEPNSELETDRQAAQVARQFTMGWFAHPIFSQHGDYPPIMRQLIDRNSQREGRSRSKLPRFSPPEIEQIKGSCDFFAFNHYTSAVVSPLVDGQSSTFRMRDARVFLQFRKEWPSSSAHWSRVVPSGIKAMLLWIKREFNNPPVYVYENGYCDQGQIRDVERIDFYKMYLKNLLEAIKEHDVNVIGYHVWTLLDAFEWLNGYSHKYGIVSVDYDSANRIRTPKLSALFWKQVCEKRAIPQTEQDFSQCGAAAAAATTKK